MSTSKRTPEDEADRLIGEAIDHSSDGRRGAAALCIEDAIDRAPQLPEATWELIEEAKENHGREFRRLLREARQFIEAERDAPEAEGSE